MAAAFSGQSAASKNSRSRLWHLPYSVSRAYRIYRDTRFSADKTPLKTYFSALISPTGRHSERAAYYLHMGVDECALYGGVWCPDSKTLKKLRKAIVDNIEEFRGIVEDKEVARLFPGWWGRALKTAPKGLNPVCTVLGLHMGESRLIHSQRVYEALHIAEPFLAQGKILRLVFGEPLPAVICWKTFPPLPGASQTHLSKERQGFNCLMQNDVLPFIPIHSLYCRPTACRCCQSWRWQVWAARGRCLPARYHC